MRCMSDMLWVLFPWMIALTGCRGQVTITTEPSSVTVSTGEVAVFTCTLMVSTNIDDRYIMWKRFDDMGNNITLASTGHYMISNDLTVSDIINSTLTITDVRLEHAGLYRFEILNYIRSSKVFLNVDSPIITTQPSDVTMCTGVVTKFICKIDRNGKTGIGIDDVLWQQLRSDSISNISSGLHPFSITTTISSDILTSTLTISDVRCAHNGSYRCIVPDVMSRYVMSRYASLIVIGTKPSTPILLVSNITSTSFVVQWDEVNGADYYIVNWRGGSNVRESISQTSIIITQLSPNTTYNVTVTAGNICGSGRVSDILIVTTNGPSISSVTTTTSSISSMVAMATTTTLSSSMMNTSPISSMTAMSTVSMSIPTSLSLVMSNTLTALSLATPTASSSSSSSDEPGVLVVIFSVIAIIAVVAIAALIVIIIAIKKTNSATQQTPAAAPDYEIIIDKLPHSENELKNPTYSTPHEISHDKHPITSTDEVLYEVVSSPSHTTVDIKLQQNPAYATSDKVIMDDNPAYRPLK
ncbi:uncharacterized protein [Dysidea avara]|uniref:uncharacterized protein isoform X2 n=1 Tax=Dysidea avara TaxID=196820 RepID=UPI0033266921